VLAAVVVQVVLVVGAVAVGAICVNEGVHVLGGVADAEAEEGVALGGAEVETVFVSLLVFVLVRLYSLGRDVHVLRIFVLILDLANVLVMWDGQELLVEFGVGSCIVCI